ncbi:hypothetical protein PR048_001247 [Dryococelus australis]|uniref:Uncharacterized protein n=1 Tax=Dryococelus australis TaxID=614101 RepID=A0ABQ9IGV4_9NEOP|nr:hypothetical protein PR048_001247 [Dryococelus australis]
MWEGVEEAVGSHNKGLLGLVRQLAHGPSRIRRHPPSSPSSCVCDVEGRGEGGSSAVVGGGGALTSLAQTTRVSSGDANSRDNIPPHPDTFLGDNPAYTSSPGNLFTSFTDIINSPGGGSGGSPRRPADQRHRLARGDPDRDRAPIALVKDQRSDRLTTTAPLNGTEIIALTAFPDLCPRKDYTRPSTIKKDLSSEKKSEDSDLGTERRLRSSVTILPLKDSVIARALEWGDAWGEIIHARAVSVADLVAAEAKYHKQCRWLFASPGRGRAGDECRAFAFTKLYAYMDSAEDSQFLLSGLVETMKNFRTNNPNDSVCTTKYLKEKQNVPYGNSVFITELSGKSFIVKLKGSVSSIVHDKWYLDKKNTEEKENIRIVEATSDIIRRDIRSLVFDTKIYPAMESLDLGQLPEILKTFLNRVIQGEVVERMNTAIGEAMMSACRPRSYISPTVLGIGVYIHRHQASRQLVDILSSLSFSTSYEEVQNTNFRLWITTEQILGESKKGNIQYAFDNADFNIRTLTGHGTFHSMGSVRFITSAQNQESVTVNGLLYPPSADTIATRGKLQVNCYKKSALPGLKDINIRELATVSDATARSMKNAIAADIYKIAVLFILHFCLQLSSVNATSRVACNSSAWWIPSHGQLHGLCWIHNVWECVTEALWMQVYAKSSITHMISGHAFSRAVRAHMLTTQALITIILGIENLFRVYQEELHKLFLEVSTVEKIIPDAVESPMLVSFLASFERKCTALSEQSHTGNTCGRWTYCASLSDLKGLVIGNFIYSWRTCMLLDTHYAKLAHLYVQQME